MLKKEIGFISALIVIVITSMLVFSSCKSCNKTGDTQATHVDSTATSAFLPVQNPINLPHADSALAPVLSKIMDNVFEASKNKDYSKLASFLAYRGPDMKRMGNSVFNAQNQYERGVVRITAEVFNKWNSNVETRDYARVFSLPQQGDSRSITVLEVIFVSKKGVNRKFFGFLPLNQQDDYKIVDVTSNLDVQ